VTIFTIIVSTGCGKEQCGVHEHKYGTQCVCDDGYRLEDGACHPQQVPHWQVEPAVVRLCEWDEGGSAPTWEIVVRDTRGVVTELQEIKFLPMAKECGTFFLQTSTSGMQVTDSTLTITGWFQRVPFAPEGCLSSALIEIIPRDKLYPSFTVPLFATPDCDSRLLCFPSEVQFEDALANNYSMATLHCRSAASGTVTVTEVLFAEEASGMFFLGMIDPRLPAVLSPGEELTIYMYVHALEFGSYANILLVRLADGEEVVVPVSAEVMHERPLCSDPWPELGDPPLRGDGYFIILESSAFSEHAGRVRSNWVYPDELPMISDILITSGGYNDPACEVGQDGHRFWWRGEACVEEEGSIANIHAIPANFTVARWIRDLEPGLTISVFGYEVDSVNYTNGTAWTDAGCNTMVVMYVCEQVEEEDQAAESVTSPGP